MALALGCLLGKLFKGKGLEGLEGFDGLNGLNCAATKGFIQFRTCSGPTGQVPHLRWSQAPPRPWRRPGSADYWVITTLWGLNLPSLVATKDKINPTREEWQIASIHLFCGFLDAVCPQKHPRKSINIFSLQF